MYFVYIVECADGTYYTGITTNVERRLYAHNHLKAGARYTSTRRPVVLRHVEEVETHSQAIKREIQIKTWDRKKKIALLSIH